jgi:opacity protein-like surface antigen
MRKALLATASAIAVMSCATFALAQAPEQGPAKGPVQARPGVQQHPGTPGGAMNPGGPMNRAQQQGTVPGGTAQIQQDKLQPQGSSVPGNKDRDRTGQNQPPSGPTDRMDRDRMGQGGPANGNVNSAQERQNASPGTVGGNGTEQHIVQGKGQDGASAKLSVDQRSRIRKIIGTTSVARVDHPDFSVTVGTAIPRSVHVIVLPEEIVQIVPEYRGFDYVLVGDQILIIDPESLEIVDIIPA